MKNVYDVLFDYKSAIAELKSKSSVKEYLLLKNISRNIKQQKSFDKLKCNYSVKKYERLVEYVQILENPVDNELKERINYIINLGLDIESMKQLSSECLFENGLSVSRWFESFYEKYINCFYDDEDVIQEFKRLYLFLIRNTEDLGRKLKTLQISLMLDDDSFLEVIGIKSYLYKKIINNTIIVDEVLRNKILLSLEKYKSNCLLDSAQEKDCFELYNYIKNLNVTDRVKVVEEQLVKPPDYSINTLCKRFDLIKEVAINSNRPYFDCDSDKSWSNTRNWWSKILSCNVIYRNEHYSKYVTERVNEIKDILCREENYVLNQNSNLNYGMVIDRLCISFNLSNKLIFNETGIPLSIIEKIRNNSFYPAINIVDKLVLFVQKLIPVDDYQSADKMDALILFRKLIEELEKCSFYTYEYYVFDLDHLEEYERVLTNIDKRILNDVKTNNFDWYVKFATYYYILNDMKIEANFPGYFYDGSLIHKWFYTQDRNIKGSNVTCVSLNDNQRYLFNLILQMKYVIQKKGSAYNVFVNNIDFYCNALIEYIKKGGNVSDDNYIGNHRVVDLWGTIRDLLGEKDTFLSMEQLNKLKEVKRVYLMKQKNVASTKAVGIDFGYELCWFVECLGISLVRLAEISGCKKSKLYFYSTNKIKPTPKSILELKNGVLNIDRQDYRDDQIIEIDNFLKILDSMLEERKNIQKVIRVKNVLDSEKFAGMNFGHTGNVWQDIDNNHLNRVKENDMLWFHQFIEVANYISNNMCKSYKRDVNWQLNWYIDVIGKALHNSLDFDKEFLVYYLQSLNQWHILKDEYRLFIDKLEALEDFIYKNNRVPELHELTLSDGSDSNIFYRMLRDNHLGFNKNYLYIDNIAKERIKSLIQYAWICSHDYGDKRDYIDGDKMYIGMHMDIVRLSLGLSIKKFASIFGEETMKRYLSNKEYVPEDKVQVLINYLNELDFEKLREDQISDVNYVREILQARKLYSFEVDILKLLKNDINKN